MAFYYVGAGYAWEQRQENVVVNGGSKAVRAQSWQRASLRTCLL